MITSYQKLDGDEWRFTYSHKTGEPWIGTGFKFRQGGKTYRVYDCQSVFNGALIYRVKATEL